MKYSKKIMDEHGWKSAIIVTDAFHLRRALLVAAEYGIDASGAPAKNSVLYTNNNLRRHYTLREVAAITAYYMTPRLGPSLPPVEDLMRNRTMGLAPWQVGGARKTDFLVWCGRYQSNRFSAVKRLLGPYHHKQHLELFQGL